MNIFGFKTCHLGFYFKYMFVTIKYATLITKQNKDKKIVELTNGTYMLFTKHTKRVSKNFGYMS